MKTKVYISKKDFVAEMIYGDNYHHGDRIRANGEIYCKDM